MKINTDGVLLAAQVESHVPKKILDIGTGTGVIALMLAQRFGEAQIEAIDSNPEAIKCANSNFNASPFASRLHTFSIGFEQFQPAHRYDLIVSNPPFFINSLKNPSKEKTMARHAPIEFFEQLFEKAGSWLSDSGTFQLIWPPVLKEVSNKRGFLDNWTIQREIAIRSYEQSPVIRTISQFGKQKADYQSEEFIIYEKESLHSIPYRKLLEPFFLNF